GSRTRSGGGAGSCPPASWTATASSSRTAPSTPACRRRGVSRTSELATWRRAKDVRMVDGAALVAPRGRGAGLHPRVHVPVVRVAVLLAVGLGRRRGPAALLVPFPAGAEGLSRLLSRRSRGRPLSVIGFS